MKLILFRFKRRHDTTECEDLQKLRQNHPADLSGLFNLIFPYRFLRLKKENPKIYNKLMSLEGHLNLRKKQVITKLTNLL